MKKETRKIEIEIAKGSVNWASQFSFNVNNDLFVSGVSTFFFLPCNSLHQNLISFSPISSKNF